MFLELSFTMIALSFLRSETVCGATLLAFQELYINEQTIVLTIVMILVGFDGTYGGHVLCGATAHGSPGGHLQFDRLEAALAVKAPLKSLSPSPL